MLCLAVLSLMTTDTPAVYQAELEECVVYAIYEPQTELLARLIYSEAGNQPEIGQLAVANVVLNRMQYYNETLEQVIFKPRQFCGVKTKNFRKPVNPKCYEVAHRVLKQGERVLSPAVMYFLNPRTAKNRGWVKRLENQKAIRIYDHTFYYHYKAYQLYGSFYGTPSRA